MKYLAIMLACAVNTAYLGLQNPNDRDLPKGQPTKEETEAAAEWLSGLKDWERHYHVERVKEFGIPDLTLENWCLAVQDTSVEQTDFWSLMVPLFYQQSRQDIEIARAHALIMHSLGMIMGNASESEKNEAMTLEVETMILRTEKDFEAAKARHLEVFGEVIN